MQTKNNGTKKELLRQAFHICLGIVIIALIYFDLIRWWGFLMILLAGLFISFLSVRKSLPVISYLLEKFERDEVMGTFPGKGAFYFTLGSFLAFVLFEKNIAMASIMILALGDSVSPLVGIYHGKIQNPLNRARMIEGTFAGFIAGFLGALLFVNVWMALLASFAAMFFEFLELKLFGRIIDDNLLMPLVAGGVMVFAGLFF